MYLRNELIGLDIFVLKNENPFDRLKEEIKGISERVAKDSGIYKLNTKGVNSIINKLIKQPLSITTTFN